MTTGSRRAAPVWVALASIALALGTLAGGDISARAGTACPAAIQNSALGTAGTNSGCELGSTNNDFLGPPPIQVNEDAMFGETNWAFQHKTEFPDPTPTSGTFDLASALGVANPFNVFDQILFVLKGSNPNPYAGYLFVAADFIGTDFTVDWQTVFFNTGNGNPQGVSHISLYTTAVSPVPLPAALPLLLAALAGLGLFGWVRRRQQAV